MLRIIKRIAKYLAITIGILFVASYLFIMTNKTFGKNPEGARLERIKKSPNYKDEAFVNFSPTEVMLPGVSMGKIMKDFFNKPKTNTPLQKLPSVKTDLKNIN